MKTDETYEILTIPAGRSSGAIRIPIIDNQVYQPAEKTFTLQLRLEGGQGNACRRRCNADGHGHYHGRRPGSGGERLGS